MNASINPLNLRRDPVRLALSKAPWVSARYLSGYLFIGSALFAIALTAAVTGASVSFTLVGLPVLVAAAAAIRWCANVERTRLRGMTGEPVRARYREAAGSGVMSQVRARWRDPATWRDIAYLIGLWAALFTLDLAVLTIWLVFLAGITLPIWYWAPWMSVHGVRYHGYQLGYFPNGPHASPTYGLFVDTLPKALLCAAAFLILFLLFNYVLVATARAHLAVVRSLLGPPQDPLRDAKEVLNRPGPLDTFTAHSP